MTAHEADGIDVLKARLAIIEASQDGLRQEMSQLHYDYNVERGFNRLFRVVMVAVMIVSIGMMAWQGFMIHSYMTSHVGKIQTAIRHELKRTEPECLIFSPNSQE